MSKSRSQTSKISSLNHSIGLDRGGEYSPDYDSDSARQPHETHTLVDGVCSRCSARAHWPAVEHPCLKDRKKKKREVHIDHLHNEMAGALDDFISWWKARQHKDSVPSLNEWIAELIEYRKQHKKR